MSQIVSLEELTEINKRLKDKYGIFNDLPCFRVIWSEDCWEHRTVHITPEGLRLTNPEVRLVKKYSLICKEKFILEGLRETPIDMGRTDFTGFKIAYEIIWQFSDKNDNPLPPTWRVCYFILEQMKENQLNKGKVKYKDPNSDPEEALELQRQRIVDLERELYGNETPVGDALAYDTGVTVGDVKGKIEPQNSIQTKETIQ